MASATWLRRLAAGSAILLLAATGRVLAPSTTAAAASVTPTVVEGNPVCADFGTDGLMLKLEGSGELGPGDSDTYSIGGLTVTIDIYATEFGTAFDWSSNAPVDVVVAKGGPRANVYIYGGSSSDTELHAPLNESSDAWHGLSHISFCGDQETTTTTSETTTSTTDMTTSTSETTTTATTRRTTRTTAKPELGAIGDYVWFDIDNDGSQGDPSVETPVMGATVELLAPDGALLESQVTGADGLYLFDDLEAGRYRIQVRYAGAEYTVPRAAGVSHAANSDVDPLGGGVGRTALISLAAGEIDLTWDAGIVVSVLGIQIESSTTTTVEPVTLETLPFTGSGDARLVTLAVILMSAGGAALLTAVVRRPSPCSTSDSFGDWHNH